MFTFIVTSAIRTRFGVFDEGERLAQTLETIQSIKTYAPGSKIVLLECSSSPISDHVLNVLKTDCDQIILFKEGAFETSAANITDNHDIVKNLTEARCFARVMELIDFEGLRNEGCERIFKLSGRYQLTSDFDSSYFTQPYVRDRICVKHRVSSQFPTQITDGQQFQYMCRLWSFPIAMAPEIAAMYKTMHATMSEFLDSGRYMDIEHGLYRFIDKSRVHELLRVGVTGQLGPNGVQVLD